VLSSIPDRRVKPSVRIVVAFRLPFRHFSANFDKTIINEKMLEIKK